MVGRCHSLLLEVFFPSLSLRFFYVYIFCGVVFPTFLVRWSPLVLVGPAGPFLATRTSRWRLYTPTSFHCLSEINGLLINSTAICVHIYTYFFVFFALQSEGGRKHRLFRTCHSMRFTFRFCGKWSFYDRELLWLFMVRIRLVCPVKKNEKKKEMIDKMGIKRAWKSWKKNPGESFHSFERRGRRKTAANLSSFHFEVNNFQRWPSRQRTQLRRKT